MSEKVARKIARLNPSSPPLPSGAADSRPGVRAATLAKLGVTDRVRNMASPARSATPGGVRGIRMDIETPQDIAAALAFASKQDEQTRIGIELLCLHDWPTSTRDIRQTVGHKLLSRMYAERDKILVESVDDRLRETIAANAQGRRPRYHHCRDPWPVPKSKNRYQQIIQGTLVITLGGRRCDTCQGRGEIVSEDLTRPCGDCKGRGQEHMSAREIWRTIGISRSPRWNGPIEWALDYVGGALRRARAAFLEALGD